MNNAVRHARPSLIEVRCSVDAPGAEIVVQDDGSGHGDRPAGLLRASRSCASERCSSVRTLTIEDAEPARHRRHGPPAGAAQRRPPGRPSRTTRG